MNIGLTWQLRTETFAKALYFTESTVPQQFFLQCPPRVLKLIMITSIVLRL